MKYLFIVFLTIISCTIGFADVKDSARENFFELSYFKSPTLKNGIFKMDQRGIELKLSLRILEIKKNKISLNPFYTNLTNILYRGNFIERPALEAFSILKILANSIGIGLGFERSISEKLKVRLDAGISNTSYSLMHTRDKHKDTTSFCSNPNDSGFYFSSYGFEEVKLGYFVSASLRYKLNNRLSLSVGYLIRSSNYNLFMYSYRHIWGLTQEFEAEMRPSVSNVSIGLCYNFSLEKFK